MKEKLDVVCIYDDTKEDINLILLKIFKEFAKNELNERLKIY